MSRFCDWCQKRELTLEQIKPMAVAAYIEELGHQLAKPSVKQHLAAIRMLFDWLVRQGQVLSVNPAATVHGPKYVIKKGKAPVLLAEEARQLLDAIDVTKIAGLRDRALIGMMVYSFARVGAAVAMNVDDYFVQGKRSWFRLHEKGGKHHEVPAHRNTEAYLDEYLHAAGLTGSKGTPLFPTLNRQRQLTDRRINRYEVLAMIKRRAKQAGLSPTLSCHTFRATGITAYLDNGGTIEKSQQIAAYESPRTTKAPGESSVPWFISRQTY